MSRNNQAEQTLNYIQGILTKAEEIKDQNEKQNELQMAFSRIHEFFKRKQGYNIFIERLMYEFIDLAFNTNKHFTIKQILKSYRSFTQDQYSESLKDILEYYRDKKLQAILDEEITDNDLKIIINMPDIQNDDATSQGILSSFQPHNKQILENLKNKLKIVWDGYKSIIDTVRVNQKLQSVYMGTLNKVFQFIDRFNRKHEFQAFCKTLRSGLNTAFNKRDKTQTQKARYIDLEKVDVNNRNIDIRMKQFTITTKLGLWRQSFQVLQDINNLMKIRKGVVKNSTRCQYYENLAFLFKKSNYWHYHAFAYLCFYQIYITKSKISAEQRQDLANNLLLSVMCIPPVTIESKQNKSSQQKICSMLISSTKIPSKQQLYQLMLSKGIIENASENVRQLWNFMFLQFDLTSLANGLDLLTKLPANKQEFKDLLENSLIYKQLISVAQVYQKIKVDSLLNLIPLPKNKILKILLDCHEQQIIDFSLDQSQGIIIFEDKNEQINPVDQFESTFLQTVIAKEQYRQSLEEKFIKKKFVDFLADGDNYYWVIRTQKIKDQKQIYKKPKQQFLDGQRRKKNEQKQAKLNQQFQRKEKQRQSRQRAEKYLQDMTAKRIIIEAIIKIKQNRVVRISGKKIENLQKQDLDGIKLETLRNFQNEVQQKVQSGNQQRIKKAYMKVDYLQRERRQILQPEIEKCIIPAQVEKQEHEKIKKSAKQDYDERKQTYNKIVVVSKLLQSKIEKQMKLMYQNYEQKLADYKKRFNDEFKNKIFERARQLKKQAQEKKKIDQENRRKLMQQNPDTAEDGKWFFKNNAVREQKQADSSIQRNSFSRGDLVIGGLKPANKFQQLAQQQNKKDNKQSWIKRKQPSATIEQKPTKKEQTAFRAQRNDKNQWFKGKKEPQEPVPQQKVNPAKFQAPPVDEDGWINVDKKKKEQKKQQPPPAKKMGKWG